MEKVASATFFSFLLLTCSVGQGQGRQGVASRWGRQGLVGRLGLGPSWQRELEREG